MERLKVIVRNIPWSSTEDDVAQAAAKVDPEIELLQFKKGKAPSRFKQRGHIPGWAIMRCPSNAVRDGLVASIDAKPFSAEHFPSMLVSVEYCLLGRTSFVKDRRGEILDDQAGLILEDPDYLSFCETLKKKEETTTETSTASLEAWLAAEAAAKEEKAASGKLSSTQLVSMLIDKWYRGKKLPWEIAAEEEEESRSDRKRDRRERSRDRKRSKDKKKDKKSSRSESRRSRGPTREQEIIQEADAKSRKNRDRKERRKRAKQREEKEDRRERERREKEERKRRKKAVIEATAKSSGTPGSSGKPDTGKKNTFSVTNTKAPKAKDFPSLPGDTTPASPALAGGGVPKPRSSHADPTATKSGTTRSDSPKPVIRKILKRPGS